MRSTWGNNLQLTIFGESHGPAIGVVVDGLPIGLSVDEEAVARDMARRAPGQDPTATARREADRVRIVSGLYRGHTTGAPLCGLIENTNVRSGDYEAMQRLMRPGHADYAGYVKYRGMNDPRGVHPGALFLSAAPATNMTHITCKTAVCTLQSAVFLHDLQVIRRKHAN